MIMTSSSRKVVCMFRIKFPTKRIFRIFPILRTVGMAPFWKLFTERPSYNHVVYKHCNNSFSNVSAVLYLHKFLTTSVNMTIVGQASIHTIILHNHPSKTITLVRITQIIIENTLPTMCKSRSMFCLI